jgi:hypothetical protein
VTFVAHFLRSLTAIHLDYSEMKSNSRRADERTRTADLVSLRVIGHVLQGLAQECSSLPGGYFWGRTSENSLFYEVGRIETEALLPPFCSLLCLFEPYEMLTP